MMNLKEFAKALNTVINIQSGKKVKQDDRYKAFCILYEKWCATADPEIGQWINYLWGSVERSPGRVWPAKRYYSFNEIVTADEYVLDHAKAGKINTVVALVAAFNALEPADKGERAVIRALLMIGDVAEKLDRLIFDAQ